MTNFVTQSKKLSSNLIVIIIIINNIIIIIIVDLAIIINIILIKAVVINIKFIVIVNEASVTVVGAVGKISAFRPQGPQFETRLCRDLNLCATFFSA